MALNVRVYVLDFTYCIISVLIDERYAAGLGRIDYRLLAALLFPPKLTLSLVRSRFVCFFSCVFRRACGFRNLRIKLRKLLPESTFSRRAVQGSSGMIPLESASHHLFLRCYSVL